LSTFYLPFNLFFSDSWTNYLASWKKLKWKKELEVFGEVLKVVRPRNLLVRVFDFG